MGVLGLMIALKSFMGLVEVLLVVMTSMSTLSSSSSSKFDCLFDSSGFGNFVLVII